MKLDLSGLWRMNCSKFIDLPAQIPGSVLSNLLAQKKIPDPFYRDNEAAVRAYLTEDYSFCRTFCLTAQQLSATNFLFLDGIDTVAAVEINGQCVASLRDMHTPYQIRLDPALLKAENTICVRFTSPYRYIENYDDKGLFETYAVTQKKSPCIRKVNSSFGWDWGPDLADMGIYREISILSTSLGYLEDFKHTCTFLPDGSVQLQIDTNVHCLCAGSLCAELAFHDKDHPFSSGASASLSEAQPSARFVFRIPNPRRWNPVGYGKPNLYDLKLTLSNESETQTYSYRIGLREVEIDDTPDEFGTNFAVKINGNKVFLKGACYIPEDSILPRITPERTARLLDFARDYNHNVVRIWGGGYYPTDDFYDYCDENGILVWQDLMFACAAYNISDEDFRDLIVEETVANVKRFRHHASVFLISGDNECEDGINGHGEAKMENYRVMSEELLVPLMHSLTDTYFLRTSPRSVELFRHPNDLDHYDSHFWRVWCDDGSIDTYKTIYPRMLSEVGHQAFPQMDTIRSFAEEEDLRADSPVMLAHQKQPGANARIGRYVAEHYGTPASFEGEVYLSQLMQAETIELCTTHLRQHRERCNGIVYWQLNDCWPVISWSSVDYALRPKALHYASRRFFAPHFVSFADSGDELQVYASNDSPEESCYLLTCEEQAFDGTVIWRRQAEISVPAGESIAAMTLPKPQAQAHFVYARLETKENSLLSENYYQAEKDINISYPVPTYRIRLLDEKTLEIESDTFVKGVMLTDHDAIFSDNFFCLRANSPKRITSSCKISPDTLVITSLNETRMTEKKGACV